MLRKEPGMLKQTNGTVNFYTGIYNNKPEVSQRSQRTGEFLEAKIWKEHLLLFIDKMPKLFSATFRLLFLFVWANSDRLTVSEWAIVCLQQR
jgi:hypothetical protein